VNFGQNEKIGQNARFSVLLLAYYALVARNT